MKGLATLAGLVVGTAQTLSKMKGRTSAEKQNIAIKAVTGYDMNRGTWEASNMTFTIPAAAGFGVSTAASKLKYNNRLPKGINL